jgi:hypothetical protein
MAMHDVTPMKSAGDTPLRPAILLAKTLGVFGNLDQLIR